MDEHYVAPPLLNQAALLPQVPTEFSSAKDGFSLFKLKDTFCNKDHSTMFVLETDFDDFVDNHLLGFSRNCDPEQWDNFFKTQLARLEILRNVYSAAYQQLRKHVVEQRDFQPCFHLFMLGMQEKLLEFDLHCTTASANGMMLTASFMGGVEEDGTPKFQEVNGKADLFVLEGDMDARINMTAPPGNVVALLELKSPFGPLYHRSKRMEIDQVVAEMEGLVQTTAIGELTPLIRKGALTDLFTAQLFLQGTRDGKSFHLLSDRVWQPQKCLKYLLFLMICEVTDDEFTELLSHATRVPLETVPTQDDVGVDPYPASPVPVPVQASVTVPAALTGVKRARDPAASVQAGHHFWSYDEEEQYENDMEELQFLLDCDARFRGIQVLREEDLRNRETVDPLQYLRDRASHPQSLV
jgi:hypothetical protein